MPLKELVHENNFSGHVSKIAPVHVCKVKLTYSIFCNRAFRLYLYGKQYVYYLQRTLLK